MSFGDNIKLEKEKEKDQDYINVTDVLHILERDEITESDFEQAMSMIDALVQRAIDDWEEASTRMMNEFKNQSITASRNGENKLVYKQETEGRKIVKNAMDTYLGQLGFYEQMRIRMLRKKYPNNDKKVMNEMKKWFRKNGFAKDLRVLGPVAKTFYRAVTSLKNICFKKKSGQSVEIERPASGPGANMAMDTTYNGDPRRNVTVFDYLNHPNSPDDIQKIQQLDPIVASKLALVGFVNEYLMNLVDAEKVKERMKNQISAIIEQMDAYFKDDTNNEDFRIFDGPSGNGLLFRELIAEITNRDHATLREKLTAGKIRMVGVDFDKNAVMDATEEFRGQPYVEIIYGDLFQLNMRDIQKRAGGNFHTITMLGLVDYVNILFTKEMQQKLILDLRKMLVPGGKQSLYVFSQEALDAETDVMIKAIKEEGTSESLDIPFHTIAAAAREFLGNWMIYPQSIGQLEELVGDGLRKNEVISEQISVGGGGPDSGASDQSSPGLNRVVVTGDKTPLSRADRHNVAIATVHGIRRKLKR